MWSEPALHDFSKKSALSVRCARRFFRITFLESRRGFRITITWRCDPLPGGCMGAVMDSLLLDESQKGAKVIMRTRTPQPVAELPVMSIDEILLQAIKFDSTAERQKYLDEQCGADVEMRAQVESLLEAHQQAGSFLIGNPGLARSTTLRSRLSENAGSMIGRYKLLQEIGEGGFGIVFMAEQQQPIRRKVALKIIKPGMDSKEVIARFEAERQALAMMDHPNIARVLDGGTTDTGRPYFVMELVKGTSITEYCDANKLEVRERLQLHIAVCQAVQHAQ